MEGFPSRPFDYSWFHSRMPADDRSPSLRDRIGGPWALSWTGVIVLIIGGAATTASNRPGSFTNWVAIVVPGTLAMLAVLALADVTVLRNRRRAPVPIAVVVGVGAVAGLVRGAVVVVVADALGARLARPDGGVLLATAVLGAVAVPGLALVLDNVARHRRRRADLRARLVALHEREGERITLSDALTDAAYAELVEALAEARGQLEAPLGAESSDERLAMADRLRHAVDSTLRPLSHRLYSAGRSEADPRQSWQALRSAFRRQPIFPAATALMVTLFMIPLAINPIGGFMMGATSLVLLWAVRATAGQSAWVRRHEFPVAVVVLGVGSATASVLVRGIVGDGFTLTALTAGGIVPVAMLMITSTAITAWRGEDVLTASLEEEVSAREVEGLVADRELARVSRDLAQYVHGTLQSHLLATAFAIERAVEAGDDAAFARAVDEARAALQSPPDARVGAGEHGLGAEVAEAVSLWRGFMEVDVTIDPELATLPAGTVVDVGRVVGEALGNAWKHGRARHARVEVRLDRRDVVRVVVDDDGSAPAGGPPGMGSAWLDFVAPGAWGLSAGPAGGSSLVVDLVVAPGVPIEAAR